MKYIVLLVPNWNYSDGGVNSFNFDFALGLGEVTRNSDYSVLCICLKDPLSSLVEEARNSNVTIKSVKSTRENFSINDLSKLNEIISQLEDVEFLNYVGHDVLTGTVANQLASERPESSRSIVFHHMDYESYYSIKGESTPQEIQQKFFEQREVLSNADYVIGVGPKLESSAINKIVSDKNVYQLIPGMQNIVPREIGGKISAITFGRYDKRNDRLKQMGLVAKAFAHFLKESKDSELEDPTLKVIGISSNDEKDDLLKIAVEGLSGFINITPLPYTTNRDELFSYLTSSNVCLMLSVHEGFGLVGWEAIAAGVPLIISRNTGLFKFISEYLSEKSTLDFGIYPVEINGSMDGSIDDRDLRVVIEALKQIAENRLIYKKGILNLREQLLVEYSWKKCGEAFLSTLGKMDANTFSEQLSSEYKIKTKQILIRKLNNEGKSQPVLFLDIQENASEIVFRSRSIKLTGREQEIKILNNFSSSKENFAWWLLYGEGGSGKSRLALEHMIDLVGNENWHGGFLSSEVLQKFDWDNWRPIFNTFIIIDYASRNQNLISDFIERLKRVANISSNKIRVLLIDRHIAGLWWRTLQQAMEIGKVPPIWDGSPLKVSVISDSAILDMIGAYKYFPELQMTKNKVLYDLKKNKKYNIPLYTIMALVNLRTRGKSNAFVTNVFENFVNREEEEIWKKIFSEKTERDKQKALITYITLIGGISETDLINILSMKHAFFPETINIELIAALNLINDNSKFISPIEPNLLSEYFFYNNWIKPHNPFEIVLDIKSVVDLAWSEQPSHVKDFVLRFVYDFPETKDDLLNRLPPDSASINHKQQWCDLQADILYKYMLNHGNSDGKIDLIYNNLDKLIGRTKELVNGKVKAIHAILESSRRANLDNTVVKYRDILSAILKSKEGLKAVTTSALLYFRLCKNALEDFELELAYEYLHKLSELDEIDKTITTSHLMKKLQPEVNWYTSKKNEMESALQYDFSHDISINDSNEKEYLSELNALIILMLFAVKKDDHQLATKHYNRVKQIVHQSLKIEFKEFQRSGCELLINSYLKLGIDFNEIADEYNNLVFEQPEEILITKCFSFWESHFSKLLLEHFEFAINLMSRMEIVFELKGFSNVSYSYYWTCANLTMQYFLDNLEIEKALTWYEKIQQMFKLKDELQDPVIACEAAIFLSLYYKGRADMENRKNYFDTAKQIADEHGLHFNFIYKLLNTPDFEN